MNFATPNREDRSYHAPTFTCYNSVAIRASEHHDLDYIYNRSSDISCDKHLFFSEHRNTDDNSNSR